MVGNDPLRDVPTKVTKPSCPPQPRAKTQARPGWLLGLMAVWLAAPSRAPAAEQPPPPTETELGEGVGLTVYNQNFAVVKERRKMTLPAGRSTVKFQDVAATIVPETVQFRSLAPADDARVIEQNYEFDLVSADALLDKYIDKSISVVTRDGQSIQGRLLSFDAAQLVLATEAGIELVPRGKNVKDVRFSSLPEGLLTRPTLVWLVEARQAGEHLVQVAYRADKITWRVDYRARCHADGSKLDLAGWVTVTNYSGTTYRNAQLKLMAGDVHLVERPAEELSRQLRAGGARRYGKAAAFREKAFAEYHLYTLARPATLKDRQTKQIELLNVRGIPVQRKYVYRGEGRKVAVALEFKNSKATREGLGIPLPKGPIRVYQVDADGQVEFLGQDQIDHTPKDERVKVRIGYAFELVGERTQLEERRPTKRVSEKDWRIRLRNHKPTPVRIEVIERLEGWANWRILRSSQDYEKKDYRTIVFAVDVPANAERVVTYTVRYEW